MLRTLYAYLLNVPLTNIVFTQTDAYVIITLTLCKKRPILAYFDENFFWCLSLDTKTLGTRYYAAVQILLLWQGRCTCIYNIFIYVEI